MKYIFTFCAIVLAISQIVSAGMMGYGFSNSGSPIFKGALRKSYTSWHAPTSYSNYGPRHINHYHGRVNRSPNRDQIHGLKTIQLYHQAATGASRISHSRRPPSYIHSRSSPAPPTSYIYDQTASNGKQIKIIKIVHEGASANTKGSSTSAFSESPNVKTIQIVQNSNDNLEHTASSGTAEVKTIKIIHEAAHQRNSAVATPSHNYDYLPYSKPPAIQNSNINKEIIIKVIPELQNTDTSHSSFNKHYEASDQDSSNDHYNTKPASDLETVRTLKILHAIATASGSSSGQLGEINLSNLDYSALGSNGYHGSESVELDADDEADEQHYDAGHIFSHEEPTTYATNWW